MPIWFESYFLSFLEGNGSVSHMTWWVSYSPHTFAFYMFRSDGGWSMQTRIRRGSLYLQPRAHDDCVSCKQMKWRDCIRMAKLDRLKMWRQTGTKDLKTKYQTDAKNLYLKCTLSDLYEYDNFWSFRITAFDGMKYLLEQERARASHPLNRVSCDPSLWEFLEITHVNVNDNRNWNQYLPMKPSRKRNLFGFSYVALHEPDDAYCNWGYTSVPECFDNVNMFEFNKIAGPVENRWCWLLHRLNKRKKRSQVRKIYTVTNP